MEDEARPVGLLVERLEDEALLLALPAVVVPLVLHGVLQRVVLAGKKKPKGAGRRHECE